MESEEAESGHATDGRSEPFIADLSKGANVDDWHPANEVSIKIVRCLEAIRDLSPIFRFLSTSPFPEADTRFIKSIATPLYSLATGIRDVYGEIENGNFRSMRKADRRALLQRREKFSAAVFQGKNGPLKTVRDKIGAHIDRKAILGGEGFWRFVSLRAFIAALRICLLELDFLLQQDLFAWTRNTNLPNVVRLMSVDGTLVDFVEREGQLDHIAAISLVESPREAIAREFNELVGVVNLIVAAISRNTGQ